MATDRTQTTQLQAAELADNRANGAGMLPETEPDCCVINSSIWTDNKFRRLSAHQKTVALYLLTSGQMGRIGLARIGMIELVQDLSLNGNWESVENVIADLCAIMGWEWDGDVRILYIPTWWKHHEAPARLVFYRWILEGIEAMPATPLAAKFLGNHRFLKSEMHKRLLESARAYFASK
jgi:hypothetical protein